VEWSFQNDRRPGQIDGRLMTSVHRPLTFLLHWQTDSLLHFHWQHRQRQQSQSQLTVQLLNMSLWRPWLHALPHFDGNLRAIYVPEHPDAVRVLLPLKSRHLIIASARQLMLAFLLAPVDDRSHSPLRIKTRSGSHI
jgi:hypothetical protein